MFLMFLKLLRRLYAFLVKGLGLHKATFYDP